MILPIVLYGEPVLRVKCKPVTQVTDEIRALAANMIETMHEAHGVGLATPQMDVTLQLAVIEVPAEEESVTFVRLDGEEKTLAEVMPLIFLRSASSRSVLASVEPASRSNTTAACSMNSRFHL